MPFTDAPRAKSQELLALPYINNLNLINGYGNWALFFGEAVIIVADSAN
jgi:hypothetical protein